MLPFDKDNFTFERGELIMLRLHPYFTMWSDEILRTVSLRTGYRDIYYFQPFTVSILYIIYYIFLISVRITSVKIST